MHGWIMACSDQFLQGPKLIRKDTDAHVANREAFVNRSQRLIDAISPPAGRQTDFDPYLAFLRTLDLIFWLNYCTTSPYFQLVCKICNMGCCTSNFDPYVFMMFECANSRRNLA